MRELDHCPPNAYKKEQCVICLDDKPNILFNPCLHVCVCFQCDEVKLLKDCPYCRKNIENRISIRKI